MSDRPEAINELLTGSAATAIGVAMVREDESARPDRLYDDPWASEAAQAAGTSTELRARIRAIPGIDQLIPSGPRHLGPDAEAFLGELGWELEYREGSAEAAKLGRSLPPAETTDFIVGTQRAS